MLLLVLERGELWLHARWIGPGAPVDAAHRVDVADVGMAAAAVDDDGLLVLAVRALDVVVDVVALREALLGHDVVLRLIFVEVDELAEWDFLLEDGHAVSVGR